MKKRPQREDEALRPSGILWKTTWLPLPLQPITSNSGAPLTFAHCPNFKLRVSRRRRTAGTCLFLTTVA